MINKSWILTLLLFSVYCSCTSQNSNNKAIKTLKATELKPFGRFIINKHQELELISSAAHAGWSFEGEKCLLFAALPDKNAHSYIQYELDGVYQKRIRIDGKNSNYPILIKSNKSGKHTIWIYKTTEAATGVILIKKVEGKNVKALSKPNAPLIEFIGNSITCGAAADPSETPCGTGEYHDQHNSYMAYAPRVARALGTNFILSSVSGIGVYRNWNSDGPTMPDVYEKADFNSNHDLQWNFSAYTPDIVSIALGTNDFSNGDGIKPRLPFDSIKFISKYVDFLKLVKSKYPNAKIALLSSSMIVGKERIILQNCLISVKNNVDSLYPSSKPVAVHFYKPMKARGCTGHPNVEDHEIMANELIPFFKELL